MPPTRISSAEREAVLVGDEVRYHDRKMDFLNLYTRYRAIRNGLFSRMAAGSFMALGAGSVIELPVLVHGPARISIGRDVLIGADSWLHTRGDSSLLEIGDGTRISGHCVISAVEHVRIGREVLLGRNVYIADHNHGSAEPDLPILAQKLEGIRPVAIGDGAWLGQHSVILAGVTVGAGAVVGANSVVLEDVPARTVVVGAPARVVRELPGSHSTTP
jgi:acetyltransferase-like isoleucine patch superfamily enzyme